MGVVGLLTTLRTLAQQQDLSQILNGGRVGQFCLRLQREEDQKTTGYYEENIGGDICQEDLVPHHGD